MDLIGGPSWGHAVERIVFAASIAGIAVILFIAFLSWKTRPKPKPPVPDETDGPNAAP